MIRFIHTLGQLARPLGLHYNRYVNPFVRPLEVNENANNSLTTWYI